jgi:hypothetical protein
MVLDLRHTVPIVINASSREYMPFLRRMNVLNPTVTIDMKRKMHERTMTASGRPFGVMNLAEGSTSCEDVAITMRGKRKIKNVQINKTEPFEPSSPPL